MRRAYGVRRRFDAVVRHRHLCGLPAANAAASPPARHDSARSARRLDAGQTSTTIWLVVDATQVFISYAHTTADTTLAKCVAAALRSVGMNVWFDEATLSGGDLLQDAIQKAIASSQAGVFIVSATWLNREWTMFELEQFARLDPNVVRRVPIFRAPRRDLVVPPGLTRVLGFEWLEDYRDTDARLWQLYCSVTDTPPGDAATWGGKWRALPKKSGVPLPAGPIGRSPARLRPSLKCDRAAQWTAVDKLALEEAHQLILLSGGAGQAHDHFIERIQRMLRLDPPRSIVTIDWPTRPRSRDEFLEALGRALEVPAAAVSTELAERLAFSNLLLVHPCVRARFDDEAFIRYYSEWLPDAIGRSHGQMFVKCLQPIEYPRESLKGSLMSWLRLRRTPAQENREDAEQLIAALKQGARGMLRARPLRELADLTDAELNEFFEFLELEPKQQIWLLGQIEARQATTPKDIFQALDDFLPDARSIA
jgi:hypothetical protein